MEISHGALQSSVMSLSFQIKMKDITVSNCDSILVHRADTNLVSLQFKGNATSYMAVFLVHNFQQFSGFV